MKVFKLLYILYSLIAIALLLWVAVSYVCALADPLAQAWNFWDIIITYAGGA